MSSGHVADGAGERGTVEEDGGLGNAARGASVEALRRLCIDGWASELPPPPGGRGSDRFVAGDGDETRWESLEADW